MLSTFRWVLGFFCLLPTHGKASSTRQNSTKVAKFISACASSFFSSSPYLLPCLHVCMWHSQILGSFEAKNTTCVFLHENSNMVIESTKYIFPDDKKIQKSARKWSKNSFLHFLALWPKDFA